MLANNVIVWTKRMYIYSYYIQQNLKYTNIYKYVCVHIYIYIWTYLHPCTYLVWVSCSYYQKSLQSCWLKTIREMSKITDVFPLFLEGKGQKSRCAHARTPSGDSGGQSVPLFHLLGGSGSSWACGCLPPISASIFTWLLPSLYVQVSSPF